MRNSIILLLFSLNVLFGCSYPDSNQRLSKHERPESDTLYSFSSADKKGFKDSKGIVIIQPIYTEIFTDTFKNKIAFVLDTSFWTIDKKGKKIIQPFAFDNGPDYIQEGLFRYVENNKIGYADEDGAIVIKAQFDGAFPFQNSRAVICIQCREVKSGEIHYWQGGKWGYIDRAGKIVINTVYSRASSFENGQAEVYKDTTALIIDTDGRFVTHK